MYIRQYIRILLSLCLLTGCSFRPLHETLHVVGEADSLWQQGQMYDDSTQLARTYSALHAWRAFYADEYAHACYHYGKLLRAKEDPVSAMQAFINATHSRTHDYHILGRVYSNMGSICHLAGEYSLSYDMYQHSAENFLHNNDTIAYYYALNDMAFEKAMLKEKQSALSIINNIEELCVNNDEVLEKVFETKAEAYLRTQQYDSAIVIASGLYNSPLPKLIQAQAYSHLGIKDSSVYYAKQVLLVSSDLADRYNALYILTNDDETKDKKSIRETSADRADTQKLLEKQSNLLSQAVLLLDQDLHRKPNRSWILTLVSVVLFVVILFTLVYLWKKRKQHHHILKDIEVKEQIHAQLANTIDILSHRQELHHSEIVADMEKSCFLLQKDQDIRTHLHWHNYDEMCKYADRYLYNIVTLLGPYNLSEKEMRLCILVLLKASTSQMEDLIPYAHSGLGKFKYTTARKLGTTTSKMREFLLNLLR